MGRSTTKKPVLHLPDFRKINVDKLTMENVCRGIRNPANFCLWNPGSWALESGIQFKESGILLTIGIQNPSSTDKDSRIQYLESGIQDVESRIQDCLGFPYKG